MNHKQFVQPNSGLSACHFLPDNHSGLVCTVLASHIKLMLTIMKVANNKKIINSSTKMIKKKLFNNEDNNEKIVTKITLPKRRK